ncbi:pilin [Arenimonas sp.]|uniref:pilin n=1 Tax=Arenimonas sp. TaxID=1872635 RepID=UPI002E2FE7AC|nr:pilin [Arenimonas sp.]HEX4853289.1 pilin [Arenimonas sp.]
MKSPAALFIALVFAILFSLIAYRVSVHFSQLPEAGDAAVASAPPAPSDAAAPEAPVRPPSQQQAADAIARASEVQAAVQAFYETNQAWPRSLAALSLGNPDQFADASVAAISIQPNGVVAISMKPHVARGGVIRLVPTAQADGAVSWECRATNYPAATRLPDCR